MRGRTIIADRFVVEKEIGAGGMGTVHRARDEVTGQAVALKLLRGSSAELRARFAREAEVLAHLEHPAVVRYVAHGEHESDPYLAMEWIDGEDLRQRLGRGPLDVALSFELAAQVADALASFHRLGVVHRDLNPSNLRLVAGGTQVRLIDFGLARHGQSRLTRTGAALGTPAYTAPEQLCGEPSIDASADVFSLGCVLYECLTGVPPFDGTTLAAIMAKVMFEEPEPASARRALLPSFVDEPLGAFLSKDRELRPPDGAAAATVIRSMAAQLVGALDPLDETPASVMRSTIPPPLSVTEQHLVAVVMLGSDGVGAEHTLTPEQLQRDRALLHTATAAGARVATLPDGIVVAIFSDELGAVDSASRAARCALAFAEAAPSRRLALAVGRALLAGRAPVGDVIERCVQLLAQADAAAPRVGDLAAGLLAGAFDIHDHDGGFTLGAERELAEGARTLLGKRTPFVGRKRELRRALALADECRDERLCAALLVTGPAGVGKSRLRRELVAQLAAESSRQVWLARGNPLAAGSPFSLLAQLLRQLAGVRDGERAAVRRRKVAARLRRTVDEDVEVTAAFLSELVDTGPSDALHPAVRAARRDHHLMRDQLRRAWLKLLAAECDAAPVVVLLEDLQWGDRPSVDFLDAALAQLTDAPLAVLCFARPEVHELFPKLFKTGRFEELRLAPLRARAVETLVREMLGPNTDSVVVSRIVEQSGGNALFLEELVRAAAEQQSDIPATIVAMAQARLTRLDPALRRVARAASVYGRTFWDGALHSLLGSEGDLAVALQRLEEHELVVGQPASQFKQHAQYSFRHQLYREAAYATLTDQDRANGHRHAGTWLEAMGVVDGMLLGGHFEQGGALPRAAGWYGRAAEQALRGNDLTAAIARAERAVACGAQSAAGTPRTPGPEARGRLSWVMAVAHYWRNELEAAERAGREAMAHVAPGEALWYDAAAELATIRARRGDRDGLHQLLDSLSAVAPTGDSLVALARVAVAMFLAGAYDDHARLLSDVDRTATSLPDIDDLTEAWLLRARSLAASRNGDRAGYVELVLRSVAAFEAVGDERNACLQTSNVGFGYLQLGATARALTVLERARRVAMAGEMHTIAAWCDQNLAVALARSGRVAQAEQLARQSAEAFAGSGDGRLEARPRNYLAEILLEQGRLTEAESEARLALAASAQHLPSQAFARARLAQVLLRGGASAEAYEHAVRAREMLDGLGGLEDGEMLVRSVHARATEVAVGSREAAPLFRELIALLEARAAAIEDPQLRRSFLEQVPEHVRIRSRA